MTYYKLKYGISGMTKFITEDEYYELSWFDQEFYREIETLSCGAAHERDSVSNLDNEEKPKHWD